MYIGTLHLAVSNSYWNPAVDKGDYTALANMTQPKVTVTSRKRLCGIQQNIIFSVFIDLNLC